MIEDLQNDVEQSFRKFGSLGSESKPLMYGFIMTIGPMGTRDTDVWR